jgi:hypothetical protein
MAFLNNSGDIILDAVLTDTGRMRLARGDGSFRIAKFALGDDEINYGLYDKNNASGSAYYDLDVMLTPVLEAFTNNTSFLKSKLITIPRTNLLYLPVMQLNQLSQVGRQQQTDVAAWVVSCNSNTTTALTDGGLASMNGIIQGDNPSNPMWGIVIDQGLNTGEIPASFVLDPDLVENQYIIEVDNRLGQVTTLGGTVAPVSFIDDDSIASYYLSQGAGAAAFIKGNIGGQSTDSPIQGPRGTRLEFSIKPSVELQTSDYLFTKLGATDTTSVLADAVITAAGGNYTGLRYVDAYVRVTGGQTGYRIDVPVRFIKVYNA